MDIAIRDGIVPVADGESFARAVRGLGIGAVELEVMRDYSVPSVRHADAGRPFSVRDPEHTEALLRHLGAEGLRVSALLVTTDFSAPDADQQVDWTIRATQAARELRAPALRVDTFTREGDIPVGRHLYNFSRCVQRVLDQTQDTSVRLGMENHGPVSNDPRLLDDVFQSVNNARLGLTLDVGNFYWFGFPLGVVYELIEKFAARAVHTHIKNIKYPPEQADVRRPVGFEYAAHACPLGEGNLDLRRVVGILRHNGYAGDLCIEDESLGKVAAAGRAEVLRRDVQALRDAMR